VLGGLDDLGIYEKCLDYLTSPDFRCCFLKKTCFEDHPYLLQSKITVLSERTLKESFVSAYDAIHGSRFQPSENEPDSQSIP
jgi:hypothetical protein